MAGGDGGWTAGGEGGGAGGCHLAGVKRSTPAAHSKAWYSSSCASEDEKPACAEQGQSVRGRGATD